MKRRYFPIEEKEEAVFSAGKDQLHKEAIHEGLETSIARATQRKSYVEPPQQRPIPTFGESIPDAGIHTNHTNETAPSESAPGAPGYRSVLSRGEAGSKTEAPKQPNYTGYDYQKDAEFPQTNSYSSYGSSPEYNLSRGGSYGEEKVRPHQEVGGCIASLDRQTQHSNASGVASLRDQATGVDTPAFRRSSGIGIISNAARHSHLVDVERPKTTARYGTVESAGLQSRTTFRADDRSIFQVAIKQSLDVGVQAEMLTKTASIAHDTTSQEWAIKGSSTQLELAQDGAAVRIDRIRTAKKQAKNEVSVDRESQAQAFSEKTWGKSEAKKGKKSKKEKGTIKSAVGAMVNQAEGILIDDREGDDGEVADRARRKGAKYGYNAGKYAVAGGAAIGRGAIRLGRYGRALMDDVGKGDLTGAKARQLLASRAAKSVVESKSSIFQVVKTGTGTAIENFRGSDDIGMQAITKPKDLVVGTKRSLKFVRNIGRTIHDGVSVTSKAATIVKAAGKKVISNPIIVKGLVAVLSIVIIIAVIVAIVSAIVGVIPTFSLKSEEYELSQTYLYITELDAKMTADIITEDTRPHSPEIDVYRYFLNGQEVPKSEMEVYTNADLILAFFDSKYQDYSFTGIIAGIFGTTVKGEVEEIHKKLHQIEKRTWREEVRITTTDPTTGETIETIEYVYHMDIYLTTQTWEDYYEDNKGFLLDEDQQEQYNTLQEVGVYTFRQELSSPFVGTDWSIGITSRWGWRIDPITGRLSQHLGLDIAMPGGTPINACATGTIETGVDSSYGNYIKLTHTDGSYTLYAHLSGFAVGSGATVLSGDVIGYVGTTGDSTGNHLHLEYHKDGKNLNPLIFTECEKPDTDK